MYPRDGYSLLELLLVLGLMATLIGMGVPFMRQSVRESRLTVEANALIRAVHLARSEAVKRNGQAVVCPSQDGARCAAGTKAWNDGWLVFANDDRDAPPEVDDQETILAAHSTAPGITVTANRQVFVFRNYAKRSTNGTVIFCAEAEGPAPRAVVISYTGRPRAARERSDGKPYRCKR